MWAWVANRGAFSRWLAWESVSVNIAIAGLGSIRTTTLSYTNLQVRGAKRLTNVNTLPILPVEIPPTASVVGREAALGRPLHL